MSAKLVNYARTASNEEDIRRIAATGYKEAVKFFPEEKRPTSPERIYKKSFNKANKKTIAPNPVLTKVDNLTKQLNNPLDPSPGDRCVQPYNFGYYNSTNTDINRQKGAQKEALLAATNLRRRLNPEFRKDKILSYCNLLINTRRCRTNEFAVLRIIFPEKFLSIESPTL
ncbi:hypothetical protein L249_7303 [Ophiocordyceps polyrhachis-furcata BCC 54312]|uniref:Uncharacterized protein n=1 Tax=Ophiocordyceps polyrhachis-furcata BCC 54312 TaxID=1330021 RepID=A0A367L9L7_9HYPO|nr:hypothetical protein L249_7303 [Ophiocordyceps polyrhachis-furcata BCC 54312]